MAKEFEVFAKTMVGKQISLKHAGLQDMPVSELYELVAAKLEVQPENIYNLMIRGSRIPRDGIQKIGDLFPKDSHNIIQIVLQPTARSTGGRQAAKSRSTSRRARSASRAPGARPTRCTAITARGTRCKHAVAGKSKRCAHHRR